MLDAASCISSQYVLLSGWNPHVLFVDIDQGSLRSLPPTAPDYSRHSIAVAARGLYCTKDLFLISYSSMAVGASLPPTAPDYSRHSIAVAARGLYCTKDLFLISYSSMAVGAYVADCLSLPPTAPDYSRHSIAVAARGLYCTKDLFLISYSSMAVGAYVADCLWRDACHKQPL
jgi:hypothetical protein